MEKEEFLIKINILKEVEVGDIVDRVRGFGIPFMPLKVTVITDNLIICGDWEFDINTGAEIDEFLIWNSHNTGSWIEKRKNE